jgi:hypothetical protein
MSRLLITLIAACILPSGALATRPAPTSDWKTVQEVLADGHRDPEWRDASGRSLVFYHLIFGSDVQAAEILRRTKPAKVRREGMHRLLSVAIRQGSELMVRALLEQGETPNAARRGDVSPLMEAAAASRLEIMRILLRGGADPNYEVDGLTAAHYALQSANEFGLRLLVDSGFDLERQRRIKTERNLLFTGIDSDSRGALRFLLRSGFDPDGSV